MFYLTNSKYSYFLQAMELNIPFRNQFEAKAYYFNYKMKSFDLDLHYFTENEAKAMVISDLLFCDVHHSLNQMLFTKIKEEQNQWVYPLGIPAYHTDLHCVYLKSDFSNIRIPKSLPQERIEEYRTFFMENCEKYGHRANQVDPRVFCHQLIEKFKLNENISLDQFVEYYFHKEQIGNSDVQEFNLTLNFEKEFNKINSLIESFKEMTKLISPSDSRRAFLAKQKESPFNKEQSIFLSKVLEERKALVARILNYHFRKLSQDGLNIAPHIFDMVGFKPCSKCCT